MENVFAPDSASADSQLEETFPTELTESSDTFDGWMALGKNLSYSLRYREAILAYSEAIKLDLFSYDAYRMRAGKYLATLQPSRAMSDFEKCRMLGGDESDLSYRIGLCWFFAGIYDKATEEFCHCIEVCDDELAIGAIYWEMISAWRSGNAPKLMKYYHDEMYVGHHTAYKVAVCTAMGRIHLTEAFEILKNEKDDLEFSMMAYGIAQYCRQIGKPKTADKILKELLRRDSFWISFGYLAARNDSRRETP